MENQPVPFRKTLFVCTNSREGGERPSCAGGGRGGLELLESLKALVKARGLKGKVRVARSGCLDLCEKGPNAFLYPGGEWLCGLKASDAEAIVERLAKDL
ncbi:MAG: (2Fe-2S) ferredoxin domain-containing protein [Elusimicrobia bacterium]|nr:(2Fe-2S) ferredoxin domain-containing protein [Elusimicrobiota bacterium]